LSPWFYHKRVQSCCTANGGGGPEGTGNHQLPRSADPEQAHVFLGTNGTSARCAGCCSIQNVFVKRDVSGVALPLCGIPSYVLWNCVSLQLTRNYNHLYSSAAISIPPIPAPHVSSLPRRPQYPTASFRFMRTLLLGAAACGLRYPSSTLDHHPRNKE
jgi:hypothetical protein